MTLAYPSARADAGAEVQTGPVGYRLKWPHGCVVERAVLTVQEAEVAGTTLLTLEHEAVRRLVQELPPFLPSQPVLGMVLPGISDRVTGLPASGGSLCEGDN